MNKYLWIVPFASFLSGYCIMSFIYTLKTTQTPAIVGKTVQEALRITADLGLSLRLIKEQEDLELPTGTIILQNPLPNTHIKSHQAIHCIISKRTECHAPHLVGKKIDDIKNELDTLGITWHAHPIASQIPEGLCIAQDPVPGTLLPIKTITLYTAKNSMQQFLFPDLRQKSVDDVRNFLASAPVVIHISHTLESATDHTCKDCIISDQRPRPGTIVSLNAETPIQVQLIATPVVDSNALQS